jgi:hypothetical protein
MMSVGDGRTGVAREKRPHLAVAMSKGGGQKARARLPSRAYEDKGRRGAGW